MSNFIPVIFGGKRIDNGRWVYGHYFKTPLTEENSKTESNVGWFFLSDGIERHCISQDGVAFVIDPETLCQIDPKRINIRSVQIEHGIVMSAEYMDGTEVPEHELDNIDAQEVLIERK